jgi:hypothetical protein
MSPYHHNLKLIATAAVKEAKGQFDTNLSHGLKQIAERSLQTKQLESELPGWM